MMSCPERMPPSNITSTSPPTASTIFGSAEIEDGAPVELATAMVGDHQCARAGLGRDPRVVDIEHALENELAGPQAPDPLDVLPRQRRVELGRDPGGERFHIGAAARIAREIAEGFA